jgi:hypothetical protein
MLKASKNLTKEQVNQIRTKCRDEIRTKFVLNLMTKF